MRKKGFTLIELLVVIAIIAMLLAILMPALGKVKALAQRLVCGTRLKGIATACVVYANDYEDAYPVQGGPYNHHDWTDWTYGWAIPDNDWAESVEITVGASLYLLVREADVGTESFVCPSGDEKAFDGDNPGDWELVELQDFGHKNRGSGPGNCVSYGYQLPYNPTWWTGNEAHAAYPVSGTASASMGVLADKNPWYDDKLIQGATIDIENYMQNVGLINEQLTYEWDEVPSWSLKAGNAYAHGREGQNIAFADAHVEFAKRPDAGVREDNVYTMWYGNGPEFTIDDIRQGYADENSVYGGRSKHADDSYLVTDPIIE